MSYLPASLLILGGGVIACEYASTFASLGVKVTMLERASNPLSFIDPELTRYFLQQLKDNGGTFIGGCDLEHVVWDGLGTVRALLRNGNVFSADKAFVALGRVANADTLQLGKAGLGQTDRGLLSVNDFCQTSVPHIYAVGDTIGPPALASSSMEQGRRAICHALFGSGASKCVLFPTGIYTIPEIATVGLTEQQAIERVGSPVVARVPFDQIARAQIMASPNGMLKLVADAEGRKLLGVQVVGDNATELVHLGQMAMLADLAVDTFVHSTFNFPTMAEAYRLAALEIVHTRESCVRKQPVIRTPDYLSQSTP